MNKKIIYWPPRIFAIMFIGFISLFALDAFSSNNSFDENTIGFLIHLLPTFLLILTLIFGWKREVDGGIIFIILGLGYILLAWKKFDLVVYLIMAGIPISIGILFILQRFLEKKLKL